MLRYAAHCTFMLPLDAVHSVTQYVPIIIAPVTLHQAMVQLVLCCCIEASVTSWPPLFVALPCYVHVIHEGSTKVEQTQ